MQASTISGHALVQSLSTNDAVGLCTFDEQLLIREWNLYMEMETGLRAGECIGQPVVKFLDLDGEGQAEKDFREALGGATFMLKNRFVSTKEGNASSKSFNFLFVPVLDEGEIVKRVTVLTFEAALPKTAEIERYKTTVRSLRSFLRYAPMPVFIIDKEFIVQLSNDSFNSYVAKEKTIGLPLDNVFSPAACKKQKEVIRKVIKTAEADLAHEVHMLEGRKLHFFVIRFPIWNAEGAVDAIGGYALDLTKEVEQQEVIQGLLEETIKLNHELEAQNEELAESREKLAATNKRLKQQKQELRKTLRELSDRNFELDQIMYKTSHDLRSPLTSILGLLSLAKVEKDPQKLPEYMGYMENRVEKLDNFVKSMLTYAKTSRGEVQAEVVDWEALIDESLSNLDYLSNFKQIRVYKECDSSATRPAFLSDLLRLRVIFNNLIGNAIKYADLSKAAPYIRISVKIYPEKAIICFEDNGIGIDQQFMQDIGKMFFRATEKSEGSGLGMYIVKQAIEKLEGRMEIDSALGEGTTIRIYLPSLVV